MDFVPGDISTAFSLGIGNAVSGRIDTETDQDWYRLNLVAGRSYTFQLWGASADPLRDSLLALYSANGSLLASNDDGQSFFNGGTVSGTNNSRLTFTASQTGTFFLSAQAFQDPSYNNIGNYTLTAANAGSTPVMTSVQIADYLIGGYWVAAGGGPRQFANNIVSVNLTALDADGQRLARAALATWERVSNLDFVETTGSARITFDDNQAGAFAGSSVSASTIVSSTVNVGRDWLNAYGTGFATYSFQTYIHEIGHAIGFGHAGAYNGNATYGLQNLYANDVWTYTIMSYFSQSEAGFGAYRLLGGPQVADILAAQRLYGDRPAVALADFDGDGRSDDILLTNANNGDVAAWLLTGGVVSRGAFVSGISLDWQVAGAGDFDGDGRNDDVLWRSSTSGNIATWMMQDGALQRGTLVGGLSYDWQIETVADFDADGRSDDILLRNSTNGQVATWFLTGGTSPRGVLTGGVTLDWRIAGTGDFDGDGRADDLVWRNSSTGQVAVWFLEGGGVTQGVGTGVASLDWQIVGVGDFDSDGRVDDLLMRNGSNGQIAAWMLSNGVLTRGTLVGSASLDWQVQGVGDFDADGRSDDILLRSSASGNVATWFLTDGVLSRGTLAGGASVDWMIA